MMICSPAKRVQQHRRRLKDQHPLPPGAETELDIDRIDVETFIKEPKLLNCARWHHTARGHGSEYFAVARPLQPQIKAGLAVRIPGSKECNPFWVRTLLVCIQHLYDESIAYSAILVKGADPIESGFQGILDAKVKSYRDPQILMIANHRAVYTRHQFLEVPLCFCRGTIINDDNVADLCGNSYNIVDKRWSGVVGNNHRADAKCERRR
jgi:hypothetical protein